MTIEHALVEAAAIDLGVRHREMICDSFAEVHHGLSFVLPTERHPADGRDDVLLAVICGWRFLEVNL